MDGYTCPRCGRTSYNPNDARFRYCGACHEFERSKPDEAVKRLTIDVPTWAEEIRARVRKAQH
jgi:hypothetical protein